MLGRLRAWLFDGAGTGQLPERVQAAIRRQQEQSEILIGWVQLAIVVLVTTVYESTAMPTGVVQEDYSFEIEVLAIYGLFCLLRLGLAYARLLRPWMLYLSVIADMALLMGLIYSFHYKYAQPAVFYLKVPTLLYVFLFIALRALRFEARFVLFTGLVAILGWIGLVLYAIGGRGGPPNPTDDFVEYMTGNALLLYAEDGALLAQNDAAGDYTDCRYMGTTPDGGSCMKGTDCLEGSTCVTVGGVNSCHAYCVVGDDTTCAGGDVCSGFSSPLVIGTTEYGICH